MEPLREDNLKIGAIGGVKMQDTSFKSSSESNLNYGYILNFYNGFISTTEKYTASGCLRLIRDI